MLACKRLVVCVCMYVYVYTYVYCIRQNIGKEKFLPGGNFWIKSPIFNLPIIIFLMLSMHALGQV